MHLRTRGIPRPVRLSSGSVLVVAALLTVTVGAVQAGDGVGAGSGLTPSKWSDFNGDGFADLAIGAPGDTVSGHSGAGSVTVLYGSANGLRAAGSQLWTQDSPGITGGAEASDKFGSALAAGDFNKDGYADLAIGVPGEDIYFQGANRVNGGTVHAILGSAEGLVSAGNLLVGTGFSGSMAGSALATLDCHREGQSPSHQPDGFADLAIGSPGHMTNNGTWAEAGKVSVYYWYSSASNFNHIQSRNGGQAGARLGASLAGGEFDNQAGDDLAMGSPGWDLPGAADAGQIHIWRNPCNVLNQNEVYGISMSTSQVPGEPAAGDQFGFSLAAGPTDIPGGDSVFVGVPYDDLRGNIGEGPRVDAGSVYRCGFTGGCYWWAEGNNGMPDEVESGDLFGYSLAIGELGRGVGGDLIVGIPGEAVDGHEGAGAVDVLYRDGTSQRWTEANSGIPGEPTDGDHFGQSVMSINWGDGGKMDVAMGVPLKNLNGLGDVGAVHVLYGTANGLTASNDDYWHRDVAGVAGVEGISDRFGSALR